MKRMLIYSGFMLDNNVFSSIHDKKYNTPARNCQGIRGENVGGNCRGKLRVAVPGRDYAQ